MLSDNEDAASKVRRTNVCGRNRVGAGSVSELAQLRSHLGQPPTLAARDVFDDDEARVRFGDDARELVPEAATGAFEADALSGSADILAGESPANNVNCGKVAGCSDIGIPRGIGPVAREHGAAVRVDLDLPDNGAEAGALEAEIHATDARKEAANGQHFGASKPWLHPPSAGWHTTLVPSVSNASSDCGSRTSATR